MRSARLSASRLLPTATFIDLAKPRLLTRLRASVSRSFGCRLAAATIRVIYLFSLLYISCSVMNVACVVLLAYSSIYGSSWSDSSEALSNCSIRWTRPSVSLSSDTFAFAPIAITPLNTFLVSENIESAERKPDSCVLRTSAPISKSITRWRPRLIVIGTDSSVDNCWNESTKGIDVCEGIPGANIFDISNCCFAASIALSCPTRARNTLCPCT